MKNDRQTYKSQSPPLCQADVSLAGSGWRGESRGQESSEGCHSQLSEYDGLIRQEKKTYSRLMAELKKVRRFSRFSLSLGRPLTGFSESDIGEPPGLQCHSESDVFYRMKNLHQNKDTSSCKAGLSMTKPPGSEYDVSRMLHDATLFDIETTRLIDEEIRRGCELTMEEVLSRQKMPLDEDIGQYSQKVGIWYQEECQSILSPQERDVSISWMKDQIHNTNKKVLGCSEMKQKNFNKLRLEADELYSNRLLGSGLFTDPLLQHVLEYGFTAVEDSTGPPTGWRVENWCHGYDWQNYALPTPLTAYVTADLFASRLAEWNSFVVESVRLILQRWSRVYSFSSTICCTWRMGEPNIVYRFNSGENKSTYKIMLRYFYRC